MLPAREAELQSYDEDEVEKFYAFIGERTGEGVHLRSLDEGSLSHPDEIVNREINRDD